MTQLFMGEEMAEKFLIKHSQKTDFNYLSFSFHLFKLS